MDFPDLIDSNARLRHRNEGVEVAARRTINWHAGASISITTTDDPTNEEVDVTLAYTGAGVPSGVVAFTAASSAPSGWLAADGSTVSRATYAALFSAIGTTFGSGDGSTTFGLPDIKGRVIAGKESSATRLTSGVSGVDGATLGAAGGDQNQTAHTHTSAAHTHDMASHTHAGASHVHSLAHTHTHGHTHTPNAIANFLADGGGTMVPYGDLGSGGVYPQAVATTSGTSVTNTSAASVSDTGGASATTTGGPSTANTGSTTPGVTGSTGAGSTQNVQPTIVLNAIIKT